MDAGDRGISEVIGAILVFGFLVAALGLYQVTVVPANNEDIEQRHSAEVRGDMVDLHSALIETGYRGTGREVTVSGGTRYPVRAFALNPAPPSGRVVTEDVSGAVELSGVDVTDGEARDFWANEGFKFDSAHIAYRTEYNYHDSAPVVRYEPTVLYSDFEGGDIVETNQGLIDGSRLNLVLVRGSVSRTSSDEFSLSVQPGSPATRGVQIEADSGDTITVKTRLSENQWQRLVDGEPRAVGLSYTENAGAPNEATIELDPGTYTLRVAEVGIDQSPGQQSPEYVVVREEPADSLRSGESTTMRVQVLDELGNPVEGVTVRGQFGLGDVSSRTTRSDGTATFTFSETSDDPDEKDIKIWFDDATFATASDAERLDRSVDIVPTTDREALLNPSGTLILRDTDLGDNNEAILKFDAPDDQDVTVSEVRVNYFQVAPPGQSGLNSRSGEPDRVVSPTVADPMYIGEELETANGFQVQDGGTYDFSANFCQGSDEYSLSASDYFIVTLVFDDGTSGIYFASTDSTAPGNGGGGPSECDTSP